MKVCGEFFTKLGGTILRDDNVRGSVPFRVVSAGSYVRAVVSKDGSSAWCTCTDGCICRAGGVLKAPSPPLVALGVLEAGYLLEALESPRLTLMVKPPIVLDASIDMGSSIDVHLSIVGDGRVKLVEEESSVVVNDECWDYRLEVEADESSARGSVSVEKSASCRGPPGRIGPYIYELLHSLHAAAIMASLFLDAGRPMGSSVAETYGASARRGYWARRVVVKRCGVTVEPLGEGLRFAIESRVSPRFESSAVGHDLVLRVRCADRELERGLVYGMQGRVHEELLVEPL